MAAWSPNDERLAYEAWRSSSERRQRLELLVRVAAQVLSEWDTGVAELDDAIFEAHRALSIAVGDLCRNGQPARRAA